MKKTSLKKNYIYNVLYQILAIIIPLITSPYLTRTIGAKGLGVYSYSYSFASYFVLFIMLGLNNYGNRKIARVRDDTSTLRKTFWEIYSFQFFLCIIISIIYFIWIMLAVKEDFEIYLLQYMIVFATGFDINWCFFGLEKFKITVIRNSIIKVLSAIAIFLFVHSSDDLWKYTLIIGITTLISQLIIWPFIIKNLRFYKPKLKGVLSHVKPNLILFLPVIAISLYTLMDKIMLGFLCNKETVAYYTYAEKIIMIPRSFIIALGTVILPRASNMLKNGKAKENIQLMNHTMQFSLIFSCYCAICLIAISNDFIPWFYGDKFIACSQLVVLLSPLIILNAWNNTIRTQYVIPNGLDKIYLITVSCGAITNLILNLLLIPIMGGKGAIIATLGAEFIVCFTQFMLLRKRIQYIDYLHQGIVYLILGVLIIFVNQHISITNLNVIINILIRIAICSVLYIGILLIFLCKIREDYVIIDKILSIIKIKRKVKKID